MDIPYHDDDEESLEEGWKLTEEMKLALDRSDWLHQELQKGGLRELISQVVSAKNPALISQLGQRYRHFRVFLDKLLVIANVLERQTEDDQEEETMQEFLERDWTQNEEPAPMLALKRIPRKTLPVFEPVHGSSSSSSEESDSDEEEESTSDSSDDNSDDSNEDESSSEEE